MNKRGESELSRGSQILLAALGLIAFVFAVIYLVDLIQKNIELNETGEGGWAVLGLVFRAMFVYIFAFGAIWVVTQKEDPGFAFWKIVWLSIDCDLARIWEDAIGDQTE